MLVDTLPFRLAWWLGLPAVRDPSRNGQPRSPAAAPAPDDPALRPAADLETRLTLRNLGWRP